MSLMDDTHSYLNDEHLKKEKNVLEMGSPFYTVTQNWVRLYGYCTIKM